MKTKFFHKEQRIVLHKMYMSEGEVTLLPVDSRLPAKLVPKNVSHGIAVGSIRITDSRLSEVVKAHHYADDKGLRDNTAPTKVEALEETTYFCFLAEGFPSPETHYLSKGDEVALSGKAAFAVASGEVTVGEVTLKEDTLVEKESKEEITLVATENNTIIAILKP